MLRIIAILFGIGFIFAGVGGFVPTFINDGLLFGLFEVNFLHNLFHIGSGVIAIMCATTYAYSRLYFQVFGVVYGLLAIAGFVWSGDLSYIMMHMNMADNFLHLSIAIVALYLGFSARKSQA